MATGKNKGALATLMQWLDDTLAKQNAINDALAKAESATHIKRSHLVLAAILFTFAFAMANAFSLICDLAIFVLPIYGSVKAIESPGTEDDSKWLIYWICYAAIGLVEFICWPILTFFGSQYYVVKACFFMWCMYPSQKWSGSAVIYERLIRPLFLTHEKQLNKTFSAVGRTLDAAKQVTALAATASESTKQ